MANLSNINNVLRTGSLGVGINRDPLGAFEISSATKPGIKMFNTAANGKTYEAYSDVNGNYIIYDQDADDNRFVINTSGNATFAGNVTIATDLVMSAGAINSKNLLFSVATLPANNTPSINLRNSNNEFYWQMGTANTLNIVDYNYRNTIMSIAQTSTTIVANPSAANIQNPVLFLKTNVAGYNAGISFINNGNTNSYNDLAGIASFIDSGNAKGRLEFWTRNTDGANTDVATRLTIDSVGKATFRSTYIVSGLYGGEVTLGGSSTTFGLQLKYNQDAATTSTIYHSPGYNNADNLFKLGSGSGNTNQLVLKGNGKIGIGTDSPNKALTVYGGNDNGIWIDSQGAQYTSLAFGNNGTEKANIAWDNTNGYTNITTYGNGHLALATGGSISAFLNSSGNFGIGDTAPTSISINTSSLSVGSTRGDLSGGLISKANGNVKHQQYWDSSGYSFNITANSGVFKFNGADVQVNANIKANNVDGKIYSMAASWAYVASKNDLFSYPGTDGAVWEYTIKMNPNSAGSGLYRDFYYGKLGIGIGWNGSNVTQYIWQQQDQTAPRTLYNSGGGNYNPLFRMYYSGGIYTELAHGTAWTLRIQGLSTSTYGDIFFRRLA